MKHLFSLLSLWALILFQPIAAGAQSWPQQANTYINDYADLIEASDEAALRGQLEALRGEKGLEFTILTLPDRKPFQTTGTYEDFSIGLFNEWGIGDAAKNDGILLLVLRDSREMSIELGAGYDSKYDAIAGEIIDTILIPAFKDGAYSRGITEGADAIMRQIADYPPPAATVPPASSPRDARGAQSSGGFSPIKWFLAALVALGLGWGIFGRRARDAMTRCPSCHKRGVQTENRVIQAATQTAQGRGETVVTCPHCGHVTTTAFTIAMLDDPDKPDDSDSFGGGSSSGGGASGKW